MKLNKPKSIFRYLLLISLNLSGQCLNTNSYGSALANSTGPVAVSRCNHLTEYSTISVIDTSTSYKCEVAGPDLNPGYVTITGNLIVIPGCTDTTACNYNAIATADDSSCMYFITSADSIVTCDSSYTWLLNGQTFTTSGTYTHFNSSPAPILMGTYSNSVYGSVSVSGNYAYVAGGSSGLVIIDISNPSVPALTSTYNTSGGYANGVSVSGNYAYVANGNFGLDIFDIVGNSDENWIFVMDKTETQELDRFETDYVEVIVSVPAGEAVGNVDTFTLTAISRFSSSVSDSDTANITVKVGHGSLIEFTSGPEVLVPGTSYNFSYKLCRSDIKSKIHRPTIFRI